MNLPGAAVPAVAAAAVGVLGIRRRRGGGGRPLLLRELLRLLHEIIGCPNNLATERTEAEAIKETTLTDLTGISNALSRPGLWPFIQEHNFSAVDNVGLNRRNVQILLNLIHSDHIMVRRPPYLNGTVVFVIGQAEGTESAIGAVKAVHIAFALVGIGVEFALNEESLSEKRLQPWRPPVIVLVRPSSSHDSPVLGLEFPDGGFVIIDRQLERLLLLLLQIFNAKERCRILGLGSVTVVT